MQFSDTTAGGTAVANEPVLLCNQSLLARQIKARQALQLLPRWGRLIDSR
jgi:hypothetical protein